MLDYVVKEVASFKRNHILSFVLSMCSSALTIITNIYGTTLFFSYYPATGLAYFLISNSILTAILSFIFASLLAQNAQRYTKLFLLFSIAIIALFILLRPINLYAFPFIIAVSTTTLGSISSITTWSIVPLAFGIREFKRIVTFIVQSWSMGVIGGSFMVPLVLHYFPLDSLLYLVIVFFISSFLLIHNLTLQPQVKERQTLQKEVSPLRYPFFRTILYFTALNVFLWAIIDYLFKFESALYFTDRALADFFGYYLGIVNGLAFIVGLTTTRYLLKKFRIHGLLYSTQILTFLGCLLVLFTSSFLSPLWTIAILQSLKPIIYYNYAAVAIDIVLNVLPSSLRISGKFYIRSSVVPGSITLTYFLLLFIAKKMDPFFIIILSLCIVAILFYFCYRILKQYRNTLREEVEFRRFTLVDEVKLGAFSNGGEEWANKREVGLVHSMDPLSEDDVEKSFLYATFPMDRLEETLLAKKANYYVCKKGASSKMKAKAIELVAQERLYLGSLYSLLMQYKMKGTIAREIKSRIYLAKQRALYWLAIATNARQVNELIPSLLKKPKSAAYLQAQEKALELLDIEIHDKALKSQIMDIFDPEERIYERAGDLADPWIMKVIAAETGEGKEEEVMDLLSKVFELRQIALFKRLPGEILLAIAEESEELLFPAGTIIFQEGERANGLYCICSGKVEIGRQGNVINTLEAHSYFGELALIDDEPRSATALTLEESKFLLLDKSTFDRLTEDVPEIYRTVTQMIVRYLRQSI